MYTNDNDSHLYLQHRRQTRPAMAGLIAKIVQQPRLRALDDEEGIAGLPGPPATVMTDL